MADGPRERVPTLRGRQTQAAIDVAARTVVARKGILATTVSDIAAEADRSTASFYNYYDSKEAMVREWALRFLDEVRDRAQSAVKPELSDRDRIYEITAAHWHTYRNRLAEIISVQQMAMVSDDFARYWSDICALSISLMTAIVRRAQRQGFNTEDDSELVAIAMVSMFNQFCYSQLSGTDTDAALDDEAHITTLANAFYRTIYHKETGPT
ncbi:TetR/AcrR family transcriptional regulator [Mycolicibacterium moriokaense]|nr:TetR/AcrR family transcriptional regulator [Mycolicibacterium moriokaense]